MKYDPFIIEEIDTQLSSIELFRIFQNEPYVFFLDSGMDAQKLGRFSFLGFDPFLVFRSKGGRVEITEGGLPPKTVEGNPFYILRDLLSRYSLKKAHNAIPFTCGAVGYFGYDLCHHIEELPSEAVDDIKLPESSVAFYDRSIIVDHLKDRVYIASCGFPETEQKKRMDRCQARLEELKEKISSCANISRKILEEPSDSYDHNLTSNFTKSDYLEAIKVAKEHIACGDIYQVNLSQRFSCNLNTPPQTLFERLREITPAPFSAYLDLEEAKIVSASPERFLCKRGRNIHTRPIKGTRPRGGDPVEDERLRIELLSSIKDRAEHIMIVDLERNDLGRICEYGSVLPTEFVMLESYSTVFHLVSTVSGLLKKEADAIECLVNSFPGGSITGAPKIRSMEIIDSLEPTKRSVYTGSIGYIGFDGNMDTSIVIRTFIIKDDKAYFQVGGGIVADSDPEKEYQETLDKAKGLIDALGVAKREVRVREVAV